MNMPGQKYMSDYSKEPPSLYVAWSSDSRKTSSSPSLLVGYWARYGVENVVGHGVGIEAGYGVGNAVGHGVGIEAGFVVGSEVGYGVGYGRVRGQKCSRVRGRVCSQEQGRVLGRVWGRERSRVRGRRGGDGS